MDQYVAEVGRVYEGNRKGASIMGKLFFISGFDCSAGQLENGVYFLLSRKIGYEGWATLLFWSGVYGGV